MKRAFWKRGAIATGAMLSLTTLAFAGIVSMSGLDGRIDPDLAPGTEEDDTPAIFYESDCMPTSSAGALQMDEGSLPANRFFQCVLIHFDPDDSYGIGETTKAGEPPTGRITANGHVTFDTTVYGVVSTSEGLDDWDEICAHPSVDYPEDDEFPARGLEHNDTVGVSNNTVTFDIGAGGGTDTIRVLVECIPELGGPGPYEPPLD